MSFFITHLVFGILSDFSCALCLLSFLTPRIQSTTVYFVVASDHNHTKLLPWLILWWFGSFFHLWLWFVKEHKKPAMYILHWWISANFVKNSRNASLKPSEVFRWRTFHSWQACPHFSPLLLFLSEYEPGLQLHVLPLRSYMMSCQSYDIMYNEGHVWAPTQGTFSWPGPDHRENSLNDTPSSSFYSSSRCPQKMPKPVLRKNLSLVSVRSSFSLTGRWEDSEMKNCSHGKWTQK